MQQVSGDWLMGVVQFPLGYRKQFYPKQMVRWKAETLKVCLLLVRRVCDQTFGRPLNGAEKWSRDHHEN